MDQPNFHLYDGQQTFSRTGSKKGTGEKNMNINLEDNVEIKSETLIFI